MAHEAARGFRVAAGNAQVLAVGTEFDVYFKDPVPSSSQSSRVRLRVYMGAAPT